MITDQKNVLLKRPIWLIIGLGLLIVFQVTAIIEILQLPADTAQALSLPPLVQIVIHVFWALIFGKAAFSLLRRKSLAVNRAFWWITVFIAYSVLRLVIFARSDYDRQRLPFLLVLLTGSMLLFIIFGTASRWLRQRQKKPARIERRNS